MKLNIYDKKTVIKTYETSAYDLMYGTLTDVINVIKLDDIKTGSNDEIFALVLKLVTTSLDTVNDLLKDIFDGLTDEELRNTKVTEIAKVLVDVIIYTYKELGGSKN